MAGTGPRRRASVEKRIPLAARPSFGGSHETPRMPLKKVGVSQCPQPLQSPKVRANRMHRLEHPSSLCRPRGSCHLQQGGHQPSSFPPGRPLTPAADGELMSKSKRAAVQPWRRTAEVRGQSALVGRRCSPDKAVSHAATFRLINEDGARAVSRRRAQSTPNRAVICSRQCASLPFYTFTSPSEYTQAARTRLSARTPTVKAAAAATQQADHFSVEMREKCLQSCKCAMCLAELHYIGGP